LREKERKCAGGKGTHSHGGDSDEGGEGSKEINAVTHPSVDAVLEEGVEDAAESKRKTPPVVSPAESEGDNDEGSLVQGKQAVT
jgi:hypothetical protein